MSRRDEAIKIKMQKAEAFMTEVEPLLQNRFYNTLINRLYYSCFHATKVLRASQDKFTTMMSKEPCRQAGKCR